MVPAIPSGNVPVPVPAPAVEPLAPVFNPRSASNVATYYGLPGSDVTKSLLETCADPNVDILILGFLTDVTFGGTIYPRLQLVCAFSPLPQRQTLANTPEQSPGLTSLQPATIKLLAPGLSYYPTLESDITLCQAKHGKKIFLSIGGAGNSLPLTSDQAAIAFADRLWELFGPAGHVDPFFRPFGSAVIDGFDLSMSPLPSLPSISIPPH